MNYREKTLEELSRKSGAIGSKHALVGFDGFVDKVVTAVDHRSGKGTNFTAISTIADFGNRISEAAGRSANIEIYPRMEKIGGNGPIMANALLGAGMTVKYVGALGHPEIHPVFNEFAERTDADSIADPGITHAIEFDDGKIMFGDMGGLDSINYENIIQRMGEGRLFDAVSRADLIAFLNWTMIPDMSAVFSALLDKVFPNLGPRDNGRDFFFDLADPEKRSDGDLENVLLSLKRFFAFGRVTLGLNFPEAQRVCRVIGVNPVGEEPEDLMTMARRIQLHIGGGTVVIHPTRSAACATRSDTFWTAGPHTERPLISTGGGDHFNAGFSVGQSIGLSLPSCLTLAVATSGYYVRTGKSPSLSDIDTFLREMS